MFLPWGLSNLELGRPQGLASAGHVLCVLSHVPGPEEQLYQLVVSSDWHRKATGLCEVRLVEDSVR